jgi:hypothetical protein
MKIPLSFLAVSILSAQIAFAQNSAPQAGAATPAADESRFAQGAILRAELDKTIDAKKAKPGDPVLAKTMDELRSESQLIAPKGAKIVGHIVQAAPHQGESPSTLAIAFDKLELANGSAIPLKVVVQAAAKFETANLAAYDSAGGASIPAGSGGAPNGRGSGGSMSPGMGTGSGAPPSPGATNNPAISGARSISPNAQGVEGISGVSLSVGAAQESIFSSPKHNVKLESGTQMILRAE